MEFNIVEVDGIFKVLKNNQIIFVSPDIIEVQNFINWKKIEGQKKDICDSCSSR